MDVKIGPYKNSGKKRRIRVRIDNYDIWGLDHTLAMIIHPTLIKLKEHKHGYPHTDASDCPIEISDTLQDGFDDVSRNGFSQKRWNWILDEMIWAFGEIKKDSDESFYKNGKFDKEGYTAYQERLSRGTILFGKYFQALWD